MSRPVLQSYQIIKKRGAAYFQLVRLDKPVGTLLLLWPMLIALLVAGGGSPSPKIVAIFVAGCFLMRSSGCAINDYADRRYDAHVHRTKHRPLAQNRIYPFEALLVFAVLALLAFLLVLSTNIQTVYLSFLGLILASSYPFMKRITHGPQLFLGLAFAWAVPMSYTAIQSKVPIEAWYLYAATTMWALAYDTQYALVDMKDDKRIGVKSTAIYFGKSVSSMILLTQLLVSALLLIYAYHSELLGVWTVSGVVAGFVLIAYQHSLLKGHDPKCCFKAFLSNQWLGGLWFMGFLLEFII